MKVILVDDEQKFALMLSKRLQMRGIEASVFFSGAAALGAVEGGERFDVALLDIKMPGIGGIELKDRLKRIDPRMKYVFLTGHGSSDGNSRVGADEADACMPKPLKIEDLMATLNRLVEEA